MYYCSCCLACAVKLYPVDAIFSKQAVKNNKQIGACHGDFLREAPRSFFSFIIKGQRPFLSSWWSWKQSLGFFPGKMYLKSSEFGVQNYDFFNMKINFLVSVLETGIQQFYYLLCLPVSLPNFGHSTPYKSRCCLYPSTCHPSLLPSLPGTYLKKKSQILQRANQPNSVLSFLFECSFNVVGGWWIMLKPDSCFPTRQHKAVTSSSSS